MVPQIAQTNALATFNFPMNIKWLRKPRQVNWKVDHEFITWNILQIVCRGKINVSDWGCSVLQVFSM